MSSDFEKRHIASSRRGSSIGIGTNPLDNANPAQSSSAGIKVEDLTGTVIINQLQLKNLIDNLSPLT